MTKPNVSVPELDVLWGAAQIGAFIGRSERVVFHMLETGSLPAKKIGGRWCAGRRSLEAHLLGRHGVT